jgi:hypothetical protein
MSDCNWAPEHRQALIDKHYSPEQLAALKARNFTEEDQARVGAAWKEVIAEAQRLAGSDPGAPEAQALARRWKALVEEFTQGDPGLTRSAANLWQEAWSTPATATQMPFPKEVWDFVGEAIKRLK